MKRTMPIVAALLISACTAPAVLDDDPPPTPTLNPNDPLARDAQQYAQDQGSPLEEGVARMQIMQTIGELQPLLETNEADTYAGLWLEHEPEFRVVVAFTQGGEETIRPYIEGKPYEHLVHVTTAQYTYAELQAAQQEAHRVLVEAGITASASSINVQANQVELTIGNPELLRQDLEAAGLTLPDQVVVLAIDPANLPPSNQGGVETYTGPDGQTIYFPKQPPAAAYMDALIEAELYLDDDGCLRLDPENPDEGFLVLWHHDFSLRISDGAIEVLNGGGLSVARVGERVRFGGGAMQSTDSQSGLDNAIPGMPIEACPGPYWVLGDVVQ